MEKIIFLDFDGVLNSNDWYVRRQETHDMDAVNNNYPFSEFDPDTVNRLNTIITLTGAKVVVSSSWRHNKSIEELQSILNQVGFVGHVIDKTSCFGGVDGYSIPRGCEIEAWLDKKGFQRINWSKEEQQKYIDKSIVKNYIILDDDSDMLYNQKEHFVITGWKFGLDDSAMHKSIDILNSTLIDLYYGNTII
jgi:HAD domain in Swiss Army Knife RNA repair proteins